ncbi:MAG: LuxR family transcriptional regulator, partial [Candidatus Saccharibacteria bacterium]|nr:LuxR family transcriptional regulator [Pseudorhodobacter sp.]
MADAGIQRQNAGRLRRAALVARIRADPAPVIVIEASAGMGKSWLLADLADGLAIARGHQPQGGHAFWDVPHQALVGHLPDGRLVLAKSPETAIPGLARAEVYGRVSRFGDADLLFTADDFAVLPAPDTLMSRTGGWPCLLTAALTETEASGTLTAFLMDDLLSHVPSARLVAFLAYLDDPGAAHDVGLLTGLPFVGGKVLHPALTAVRGPMVAATRALLAARMTNPQEARAIAVAQVALGQTPEAIAIFQSTGAWQTALQTLEAAGGPFFIHRFGPDAFERMLSGFPVEMVKTEETLVLCQAIQAVKRGEVPLTNRILIDRYGPVAADAHAVLADRTRHTLAFRFFRLLLRTWEDFDLDLRFLDDAYALLAEIPADDDLHRGSFYNAVLEFYIRARRFPEADHAASRAATHYARTKISILSFYVDLHRAIIRLFMGESAVARVHSAAARAHLMAARHDSPGEARLLSLLDACIDYESGQADALTRFLAMELDAFAQGEIWPSLVELTLIYGSQALGEHYSTMAARSFLDRWRVTQAQSSQFRTLIDIREVTVLQNGNRWTEAAQKAAELRLRITLAFVQAGEGLADLNDRDETALALVWLRQMAQVTPTRPGLLPLIDRMLDNPHLTARQRGGAEIWRAHVMRRQGDGAGAQVQLSHTLTQAAQAGSVALLGEERPFLTDLTATRRMRDTLDRNETVRRVLKRVAETGPGRLNFGQSAGLTRQETRVLHALSEGAANKAIANMLGLSEA